MLETLQDTTKPKAVATNPARHDCRRYSPLMSKYPKKRLENHFVRPHQVNKPLHTQPIQTMVLEVPKSQSDVARSSQLHFLVSVAVEQLSKTRSHAVQTVGRVKISTGRKWHKGSASRGLKLDDVIEAAGSSSMLLYFLASHCMESEIGCHTHSTCTGIVAMVTDWYGDV